MITLATVYQAIKEKYIMKTLFAAAILGLLMTSCMQHTVEEIGNNISHQEAINIALSGSNGALDEMFALSGDGLVSVTENPIPNYSDDEHIVRLALDDAHSLELIVSNAGAGDPFAVPTYFSAYPAQTMEDKNVYTIINYVDEKGDILYSTTSDGLPAVIQPNVFEIRQVNEHGFSARLRDLTLFEVGVEGTIGTEGRLGNTISINGTFAYID